jgi:mRNA interferase MazF
MTAYKAGDIVSVEFPFSDLQNRKRRPGLVLFGDDDDLVLARVTTHPARNDSDVTLARWVETGLPRASTVRLTKLATVDQRLVHHKIGRLHSDDTQSVMAAWQGLAAFMAGEFQK